MRYSNRLPTRNQQSTTAFPRFRRRGQILPPLQETVWRLVFAPVVVKAHAVTGRVRMQGRDPLVVTRAAHDAVFEREGEETHKIHRRGLRRVHIVCVAVDVEGIVACGYT